jgi:hypothetical protein
MRDDSQLMRATIWLSEKLAGGPRPAAEIAGEAARAGHSAATLRRAKERLAVVAQKQGFGVSGEWFWQLPRAEGVHDECLRGSDIDGDLGDLSFDLGLEMDDEMRRLGETLETELSGLCLTEGDMAFLDEQARRRR